MTDVTTEFVERLHNGGETVNWADLSSAHDSNIRLLRRVGQKPVLSALIKRARNDHALFAMAEEFDNIFQIVLVDALDRGFRLRLHLYPEGSFNRPHNHRWPFTNLPIHGRFGHEMYGLDESVFRFPESKAVEPTAFSMTQTRSGYTLDYQAIDNVGLLESVCKRSVI